MPIDSVSVTNLPDLSYFFCEFNSINSSHLILKQLNTYIIKSSFSINCSNIPTPENSIKAGSESLYT